VKYYSQNIDKLIVNFKQFSVIVLHGTNETNLFHDFKNLIMKIAGPKAAEEMRVTNFFDSEIKEKSNEILLKIQSQGFFKGSSILTIKDLSEKNEKMIIDIDDIWMPGDTLTIVCVGKLSIRSRLKKLAELSKKIAYVRYFDTPFDKKKVLTLLEEKNLYVKDEATFEILHDYAQNVSRDFLTDTLEKLSLLKFKDNTPVDMMDFRCSASFGYEMDELEFASAVADKHLNDINKYLKQVSSSGRKPMNIIQFLTSYFRKLFLIEIYGEKSSEVKREFPFLYGKDIQIAITQSRKWGKFNLHKVLKFLTIADLDLRRKNSEVEFILFTNYILKIRDF
jgi:DNA polymerase-3 subunit delta